MFKKLLLVFIALIVLGSIVSGAVLYDLIVINPGDEIELENINSILGKESPVFYSDGTSRLGVFFDEAHRQYVSYDKIPVNFINALVASEDNRFFSHFGFDIMGIFRAIITNIRAGRIVQGGSTLTQQTAKNLFKRKDRSYEAKLKELLLALRLEYHYPKEKIFEFYANQFYVSGNGHGLGVAARYYFNKKPEQLSLLECAYIAGSVKRPNYYNPFLKKSETGRETAIERGKTRVGYVLGKMLELGMISKDQYERAKKSDITFNKGQVGYSLDYVMEMVRDAVSLEEVTQALEQHNISNIATSGVRIITTVDKNLQEQTLYALRHDLSRLDVRLRGYERAEVQKELSSVTYKGDGVAKLHNFLFGTVINVHPDDLKVEVDLGSKNGTGIIDKEGIERLAAARVRWQKTPWTEASQKDYRALISQFQAGDSVWVSVRQDEGEETLLDLEKYPELKGGALVLRDGRIEAMAGGVENRFYNRAIYAKRTMGSSFKPFVYAAALQLGWSPADNLKNSRDVFVFQKQPYFPRPDHHSPYDQVSMSWAGVKSENVASVWLLANLCAHLDSRQFLEVARHVRLGPEIVDGKHEPYQRFVSRIRDKAGIIITPDVVRQAAFNLAVKNIETDLLFIGRDVDYDEIRFMHYGLGFPDYRKEILSELKAKNLKQSQAAELRLRLGILQNNYLHLEEQKRAFDSYIEQVRRRASYYPVFETQMRTVDSGAAPVSGGVYRRGDGKFVFSTRGGSGLVPMSTQTLAEHLSLLSDREAQNFIDDILLDGRLSVQSFGLLQEQVARELERLQKRPPYSMEVLENVSDYRTLVGLRYVVALARDAGIESDLAPVLSFPLGSNVVTLLETVRMYDALVKGEVTKVGSGQEENSDLLSIIDRIESPDGEILYQPARTPKRVFDAKTSGEIGQILENVVKFGTGRYADKHIHLSDVVEDEKNGSEDLDLAIPVLGKTGTANRYTNAAFLGFLPDIAADRSGMSLANGYSVGVYVGFDDNQEMRKGATKISGAAGALPAWTSIVTSIARLQDYAGNLDTVDLTFNGLNVERDEEGAMYLGVNENDGGKIPARPSPVSGQSRYTPSIFGFGSIHVDGRFVADRRFQPFWNFADPFAAEQQEAAP